MQKILEWLDGRKAYIVALLVGVGGILVSQGVVIPDYVWYILAALGLGAVRDAINKAQVK